jgi:hypothetical protein
VLVVIGCIKPVWSLFNKMFHPRLNKANSIHEYGNTVFCAEGGVEKPTFTADPSQIYRVGWR